MIKFSLNIFNTKPDAKTIAICGTYHKKNKASLILGFKELGLKVTKSIRKADFILSGNTYFNTEKFPEKKFIFGPHFSTLPNQLARKLSNKHGNACYIQPAKWAKDLWEKQEKFTNLPCFVYSFGVNTEKFTPTKEKKHRKEVLLYTKNRPQKDIDSIIVLLKKHKITYTQIDFSEGYQENDYLKLLQDCKMGIWLGLYESQGFALQEALACDVPLLVWEIDQEEMQESNAIFKTKPIDATAVPYWSPKCGEYCADKSNLEPKLKKLITKLGDYKPREFILETLTIRRRTKALISLFDKIGPHEKKINLGQEKND